MITTDIEQSRTAAYGQLPMAFIPNAGQLDARVHYYAKGPSHAIYFTKEKVVFAFARKVSASRSAPENSSKSAAKDGFALFLRFVGASPEVKLEGRRPGEGKVHYFKGSDPSGWLTDLPMYEELVYREVWPGVDAVFQGKRGKLKYTFVIQPGARLANIRLAYQGAEDLSLDDYGNLQIHVPGGLLKDERPVSYQEVEGKITEVSCDFVLEQYANGELYISLEAGPEYDHRYPLIVDPGLIYSTYLGGSQFDVGNSIALDPAGNAYIAGATASLNFPATSGAFQMDAAGDNDAFITKLNADGTALVYSAYLGGSGSDSVTGIAVDAATGEAYVTGTTNSANFPVTQEVFQTSLAGGFDVFVTKLNAEGNGLEYSTYLGGTGLDIGHEIAVVDGSAYITGSTDSLNFPVTQNVVQPNKAGDGDAFVTKLNTTGTALEFSTYLGGPRATGGIAVFSVGLGIDVDASGNVYVGGNTTSPNFPVTPMAFQKTIASSEGVADAFVTKLNPTGSSLVYSTYLGGNLADGINAIAVDPNGHAYVTGSTASANFPVTPGAFQTMLNGITDAFVTQLNADGSALVYSTYLGGSATEAGRGIKIDPEGNAYVTGDTASGNYPVTAGAVQSVPGGNGDAMLTILNAAGNAILFSTYLGGSELDSANGIAIDAAGNAYLTGNTASTNFPITEGAFQTALAGSADAFVTKIEPVLAPPPPPALQAVQIASPSPPPMQPPAAPVAPASPAVSVAPVAPVAPPPARWSGKLRRKIRGRRLKKFRRWYGQQRGRRHKGHYRLRRIRSKHSRSKRRFLSYWKRQISRWLMSQIRSGKRFRR